MKTQNKKTLYRVDEYDKTGMGELVGFFPSLKAVKDILCSTIKETKKEPESLAHFRVTKFCAPSGISDNFEAWSHEDAKILKDYYFVINH